MAAFPKNGPRKELKKFVEYQERTGKISRVEYRLLHRDNGPAKLGYFPDGKLQFEAYYLEGVRCRRDGPAATGYFNTGEIHYVEYWLEGKRHRLDGPAVQRFGHKDRKRVLNWEEYWVDGRQFTKEEFDNRG